MFLALTANARSAEFLRDTVDGKPGTKLHLEDRSQSISINWYGKMPDWAKRSPAAAPLLPPEPEPIDVVPAALAKIEDATAPKPGDVTQDGSSRVSRSRMARTRG